MLKRVANLLKPTHAPARHFGRLEKAATFPPIGLSTRVRKSPYFVRTQEHGMFATFLPIRVTVSLNAAVCVYVLSYLCGQSLTTDR